MLLLDESNVLRGIGAIGSALEFLGYALLAALTYLGVRLLWRPVRRSDGSLQWGTTIARWLTGLLLLTPAAFLMHGWLWPEWYAQREQEYYSTQQRAHYLRLVGDYQLDSAASHSSTRGHSFTLSLQADSSFSAQADLFETEQITSGRWSLNTDNPPHVVLFLEPSQGTIKSYRLDSYDTTATAYLLGSTGVEGNRYIYGFRLSKRRTASPWEQR